jgi:hypothetical protein
MVGPCNWSTKENECVRGDGLLYVFQCIELGRGVVRHSYCGKHNKRLVLKWDALYN